MVFSRTVGFLIMCKNVKYWSFEPEKSFDTKFLYSTEYSLLILLKIFNTTSSDKSPFATLGEMKICRL